MTKVKFIQTDSLPDTSQKGAIYFLDSGINSSIHLGKSDGTYLTFNNIDDVKKSLIDMQDELDLKVDETELNATLQEYYANINDNLMHFHNELYKKSIHNNFVDLLTSGNIRQIKFIGDSIAWGADAEGWTNGSSGRAIYNTYEELNHNTKSFGNSFRNWLSTKYSTVDFFNASISGHSMKKCNQDKVDWIGTDNDVLIINLGVNDLWNTPTLAEFETATRNVFEYAVNNSNHVFICTTTPVLDSNNSTYGIELINLTLKKIAKEFNLPLIDLNRLTIEKANENDVPFKKGDFYDDELTHPSTLGHNIIWLALQDGLGIMTNQTSNMLKKIRIGDVLYPEDLPSDFTMDSTPTTHPNVFSTNRILNITIAYGAIPKYSPSGKVGTLVYMFLNDKWKSSITGYCYQTFYDVDGGVYQRSLRLDDTWTPWKNNIDARAEIAFVNPWTQDSAASSFVKRNGNVVTLQVFSFGKIDTSAMVLIGRIPNGFRPTETTVLNAHDNGQSGIAVVYPNGELQLRYFKISTSSLVAINGSYSVV